MSITNDLPKLPFTRTNALDIPEDFAALRRQAPVARVLTPAGDPAWLVTSYELVKEVFRDNRLGRSHRPRSRPRGSPTPPSRTAPAVTSTPRRGSTSGCAGCWPRPSRRPGCGPWATGSPS
jgi:cytochrome P450